MKLLDNLYLSKIERLIFYKDITSGKLFYKGNNKENWKPSSKFFDSSTFTPINNEIRMGRADPSYISSILVKYGIKIKIKDIALSSRIYGFKSYKAHLLNKTSLSYVINNIEKKKDWEGHSISVFSSEKGCFINFCEEDIVLNLPNFNKIKNIKLEKGSIIKCVNDKLYKGKIVKQQKLAVTGIIKINEYNNKPDLIEVMDSNWNKMKVYKKHFHVV